MADLECKPGAARPIEARKPAQRAEQFLRSFGECLAVHS
jgi:hypothetical protein